MLNRIEYTFLCIILGTSYLAGRCSPFLSLCSLCLLNTYIVNMDQYIQGIWENKKAALTEEWELGKFRSNKATAGIYHRELKCQVQIKEGNKRNNTIWNYRYDDQSAMFNILGKVFLATDSIWYQEEVWIVPHLTTDPVWMPTLTEVGFPLWGMGTVNAWRSMAWVS